MQNKSIINNQWTSNKGQCHKYNDLVWQVGYYEKDNIKFLGIFNHLLLTDQQTVGFEESGQISDKISEKILIESTKVLVGDEKNIYGHLLLNGKSFLRKRPENISLVRWLLSSRKNKFFTVAKNQAFNDGIEVLSSPDSQWFVAIKLERRVELLNKYFERLGRNPDQEPDILCMSLKNADKEFLDFVQTKFIKSISQKKFSEINSEDFKQWNNLLTIFPEILWAIDGHLFFATQQSSKEELYNKVQQVADKYQLKIVNNHMLM